VLFDGLDEIPSAKQRSLVCDAVAEFAKRYAKSRIVVTCRTLSYQDPQWQLQDFPFFQLAPFDAQKIDRFIAAWYEDLKELRVVKAEESGPLALALKTAIRRPDMWRLAPNPLLLTVMALVHTHKGRLPDARALLYEETIDILLWRWEQVKLGGATEIPALQELLAEANRADVDLKRALWRLAFEAHRAGGASDGDALADIGELKLQKALADLHPEKCLNWAARAIDAMKLRAGLLLERAAEVFTFPHRTFQEYLAGAHLASQADYSRRAAGLVAEGAFWREVILLSAGRLVYLSGDTDKPLALAAELCPVAEHDDALAWRKAWLAGEVLNEIGLQRAADSVFGREVLERVRARPGPFG
jgi:predicted NACHT family NTPase